MNSRTYAKLRRLWRYVKCDAQYFELRQEYDRMENDVSILVDSLPEEKQNIIWKFICTSDEMNYRAMQIACIFMDFIMEEENQADTL